MPEERGKRMRLVAHTVPISERGRMLTVDTILALLPVKRSRWWVLNCFLPDKKQHLGRDPFWWERDAAEVLHVPAELPVERVA